MLNKLLHLWRHLKRCFILHINSCSGGRGKNPASKRLAPLRSTPTGPVVPAWTRGSFCAKVERNAGADKMACSWCCHVASGPVGSMLFRRPEQRASARPTVRTQQLSNQAVTEAALPGKKGGRFTLQSEKYLLHLEHIKKAQKRLALGHYFLKE